MDAQVALSVPSHSARQEGGVYAADGSCKSAARILHVVRANSLGEGGEARDGRGKHFGMKLEKVADLNKQAFDTLLLR